MDFRGCGQLRCSLWCHVLFHLSLRVGALDRPAEDQGLEALAGRAGCGDGQFWTWGGGSQSDPSQSSAVGFFSAEEPRVAVKMMAPPTPWTGENEQIPASVRDVNPRLQVLTHSPWAIFHGVKRTLCIC